MSDTQKTDQPPDTVEQLFAKVLLEIRQNFAVLGPWKNEIDGFVERLEAGNRIALEEIGAVRTELRNAYLRLDQIDQTLAGLTELAKSTYDIVAALKESKGGDEKGKVPVVRIQ